MKKMQDAGSIRELEKIAAEIRYRVVREAARARGTHVGSSLSCVDILTVLYWRILNLDPQDPEQAGRDRFLLSKGHAAAALYATLERRGFFDEKLWDTYCKPSGLLEDHPGTDGPAGVEAATGSLGHGLSLGAGMALSARILRQDDKIFVLVSDGECNEGSVWEAAMFAAGNGLDNLYVIVDFNKWQATGRSCDVMALEPLADKFRSFGWQAFETDGHNIEELLATFTQAGRIDSGPKAIIAHTVKGRGVSFMEDDNNWHYRVPSVEEAALAKKELGISTSEKAV